jgi:hypothetical protein
VRRYLVGPEVRTFVEMQWRPQLENGELLDAGEAAGFDVMVTSNQSIKYQQNLTGRKLALIVLGSNIWPIVRGHGATITEKVNAATPGSYEFIEMPLLPRAEITKIEAARKKRPVFSVRP